MKFDIFWFVSNFELNIFIVFFVEKNCVSGLEIL